LRTAGHDAGLVPVGLGARDTLRLEAGMPLYGNELDRSTNPYEAGLGRVVRLDKAGDFVGRRALEAVAARGVERRLVGLEVRERGIVRHGLPIAMAYVPTSAAEPGTIMECGVRDTRIAVSVRALPFYQRAS
jgi:aminomethyltransferase